jgi:hypothetical protein
MCAGAHVQIDTKLGSLRGACRSGGRAAAISAILEIKNLAKAGAQQVGTTIILPDDYSRVLSS